MASFLSLYSEIHLLSGRVFMVHDGFVCILKTYENMKNCFFILMRRKTLKVKRRFKVTANPI